MVSDLKALIVVDLQKDFCPGGSLAISQGDKVVAPTNKLISFFEDRKWPIFFTRDWHPQSHVSFQIKSGPWPPHCIAHTEGAKFHEDLCIPEEAIIIDKATEEEKDAYSGFDNTRLKEFLDAKNVINIVVCGLATDYCVKETALDALKLGFKVTVIREAVEAVNVKPEDGEKALQALSEKGANIYSIEQWLKIEEEF